MVVSSLSLVQTPRERDKAFHILEGRKRYPLNFHDEYGWTGYIYIMYLYVYINIRNSYETKAWSAVPSIFPRLYATKSIVIVQLDIMGCFATF